MRVVHPLLVINVDKIKKVQKTVVENRCADIREKAENINTFYGSTQQNTINILGMKLLMLGSYQKT